MLDYIAYLIAQQQTADRANEARPDSPTQPPRNDDRRSRPSYHFRYKMSIMLRRVADRLEPAVERPMTMTTDSNC